MKIRNINELISAGNAESRRVVLNVLEKTLERIDSYETLKGEVSLDGKLLRIGNRTWDLDKKRNVYIIGAGKAVNAMAGFFDELLGDILTDGIVIAKSIEETDRFNKVRIYTGGHPLPNEDGYIASLRINDMVEQMCGDDLVIGLMSGGCSSLMSCPIPGVTLNEEMRTRDVMLKSGANILEVNAVARHISAMNGGRLAQRIERKGAEIICLLIMDAMGFGTTQSPLEPVYFGFTPLAPDATTLEDARNAIINFNVGDKLPKSVMEFFRNAGDDDETPKSLDRWTGFIINTIPDMTRIAAEEARKLGLNAYVISDSLEGEGREVGTVLASIARQLSGESPFLDVPAVLIASGEIHAKITDAKGTGGPGQELALGFALAARDMPDVCIASIDSEGTDGPTDAAGGLTCGQTFMLAEQRNVDIYKALREHSACQALEKLNGKIITGNTGTNLCDLHVLYVPGRES